MTFDPGSHSFSARKLFSFRGNVSQGQHLKEIFSFKFLLSLDSWSRFFCVRPQVGAFWSRLLGVVVMATLIAEILLSGVLSLRAAAAVWAALLGVLPDWRHRLDRLRCREIEKETKKKKLLEPESPYQYHPLPRLMMWKCGCMYFGIPSRQKGTNNKVLSICYQFIIFVSEPSKITSHRQMGGGRGSHCPHNVAC